MPDKLTVCVVDDDAGVRSSLAALLESSGYAFSEYDSLSAFHACLDHLTCDCVLLDVRLPDGDGIDLLRQIRERGFVIPVIIVTGHGDVPMAVKAIHLGANDFIEKPFDPDSLLETIERVCEQYQQSKNTKLTASNAADQLDKLTPRETEVMKLLVDGQSNKMIAHSLGLSPRTVEVHRARVMEKTKASSLSHLVRMAIAADISRSE